MKTKRLISTLLFAGLLASCGTIEELTYDELRPANYSFPQRIRKVGIVNNAPPTANHRRDIVTIGTIDGDGKQTCESLAEVLADSRYFNEVIICDSAFRDKDSQSAFRTFTKEEVGQMSYDLGVDLILSLDLVKVEIQKKAIGKVPWAYQTLQTKVTPVLHAYMPDRNKPLLVISVPDSLEWEYDPLISDKFIVEEMAHAAALTLGHAIVPYWMPANRLYFDGGSVDMRDAGVSVRMDDWQEAKELWEKIYSSTKSVKKRTKAAYNLALASEMLDDMSEADRWIGLALDIAPKGSDTERYCKLYQHQIKERITQMSLLNAQMERFRNKLQSTPNSK